ncbi:MAG: FAD/NAD(P)-binding protein [Pseudomonadota bacterium]|jgi:uncharacterized NAD(P)/FAD-binding protein YdhS
MSDIAIIGGGAAGAAVFGELLQRDDAGVVHWIVGRSVPGRGVAYATDDERHLLNVRATGMGVFANHAEEFVQYAAREDESVQGVDFLPRRLFGEFVEAQVQSRIREAQARGRRFAIHSDQAVGVRALPDGQYRVELAAATTVDVDAVVLATGALSPRPLKTVAEKALTSGAYELSPWRLAQHARSPRRVLIIGTGLTAVDTLISASTRWPHAELVAVSRHGKLPFCHPSQPLAPYPLQSELNASLLDCNGVAPMLRLIREAFRDSQVSDWRAIIDGMRPINAALWQGLTLPQRRQFMRHVRWIWEASRHRTAPASFEAVEALRESGRLQVHAARVLAVEGRGPLDVTVRSRATQLLSTLQADLVIQATGLDTAVAYAADPLLSQLLQDGLAVPDPLQLGVAARPDGQLLDAQGQPRAGLYAIGSLLRGNLWECTAMPEIRSAAHQLAQTLGRRMTIDIPGENSAEA